MLLLGVEGLSAQRTRYHVPYSRYGGGYMAGTTVDEMTGDTTYVVQLSEVIAFRSLGDIKRHRRLIRNVKLVYPYALDARRYFNSLNAQLDTVTSKKERERITKDLEKEIIKRYTPVLENMTYTQGKILIRLIDRQTHYSPYAIVREFRGSFVAGFWQGIAKIFGHNLKDEYDKEERDRVLEQLILLYEADLL
jgi:hypothetical protein